MGWVPAWQRPVRAPGSQKIHEVLKVPRWPGGASAHGWKETRERTDLQKSTEKVEVAGPALG